MLDPIDLARHAANLEDNENNFTPGDYTINSEFQLLREAKILTEGYQSKRNVAGYQNVPFMIDDAVTVNSDQNVIRRKDRERNNTVLIFEIDGTTLNSVYRELTLRTLLHEVLTETSHPKPEESSKSLAVPAQQQPTNSAFHFSNPQNVNTKPSTHATPATGSATATFPSPRVGKSDSSVLDLRIRDLRRLDFTINPNEELTIQVRRNVILFSVDPIRAIVTTAKLRVVVPAGADQLMKFLEEYMRDWLIDRDLLEPFARPPLPNINSNTSSSAQIYKQAGFGLTPQTASAYEAPPGSTSFEIHSYEAILSTVKDLLASEFATLKKRAEKVLAYFGGGAAVNLAVQDKLRELKDELARLCSKVKNYRKSLHEIIEDDETMALMNVTTLAEDPSLYRYPLAPSVLRQHEEIEEALENYLTDFTSFESDLELVRSKLQGAESQAALRLDISRNRVLIANIVLSIISVNVTFGAYITGIFGMNLDNTITIQPVKGVFPTVFTGTFVLMILGSMTVYYYLVYMGVVQDDTRAAKKLAMSLKH